MAKAGSASEKMSPMMIHYREIKKGYPDTVLMYRLGDFYEMFFDDAIEASKILDLTLTGRDCGLKERAPMCGVPYHAVDTYISRLIKAGKKVAICEQLTAPGDQKGLVKRDVVRVITPGTVTGDSMLDAQDMSYIAAYCKRGNSEGVAWLDVTTGETMAWEADGNVGAEERLLQISPKEIISETEGYAVLIKTDAVEGGRLPKPEKHYEYAFSDDNAEKTIKEFYGVYSLDALGIGALRGAKCALGGLLDYITATQKQHLDHISTPKIVRNSDEMFVDYNTRRNLELTETLFDRSKHGSLLWVMDKTVTNMGARALKKAVLTPFRRAADINLRLDSVEEFVKKPKILEEVRSALQDIRDVERLRNKIAYNTINPRECMGIATSLEAISRLKEAMAPLKSKRLSELYELTDPLDELKNALFDTIADNPPTSIKDGGVIREGYSEELDKLRSAKSSAKSWIAEYEAKERAATGIKQLKIGYNRVFGYYIEVSNGNLANVPYRYERKQTLTTGERFITEELKKMEEVILGAEEKALALEESVYRSLKEYLSGALSKLQTNAYAVSETDLICSLAHLALENGYVRPKIASNGRIIIKNGRHPVVEVFKSRHEFVPNDAVMDSDSKLLVITGPNMAGKSTYMREVALIVLMAHMGSFVPATEAEISVVDRVFTRVGAGDNLVSGQSTFMVEMTEMANILNNATPDSLIILDEVGRGTSTLDGLSIAWAIVEYLSLKLKAKTLFATHYHELAELENTLPGLKNYHVLVKESETGVTFLYKISRGAASKSFGLEVARLAGLKDEVLTRASQVLRAIEESSEINLKKSVSERPGTDSVPSEEQLGFFNEDAEFTKIKGVLNDIDPDSITPMQALTILADLKNSLSLAKKRKKKQ